MDNRSREIFCDYKPILSETISYQRIKFLVKESKIFTRAMFDDIFGENCDRDFYDKLCTRGPDAFSKFIIVLKRAGYDKAADALQKLKDDELVPVYYKMDSDPIGYCLIIMNEEFDVAEYNRKGCQVDAESLKNLFEKLNYNVKIEWSKEEEEIRSILKNFSQKLEFGNVDSCIVYILSHGEQHQNLDYVLGTDLEGIYKKEICSMFNNKNCNLLIGKPKIIFFQACRGECLDSGVYKKSGECDATPNTKSQPKTCFPQACHGELLNSGVCKKSGKCDATDFTKSHTSPGSIRDSSLSFDKDGTQEMKYPFCSDMFIVHSTLPDQKSFRNDFAGSWLCQDLVSVVSKYYDKYDFATLMTFVNSKQIMRESEDGFKQVIHCEQLGVTGLLQFERHKKGATSSKAS